MLPVRLCHAHAHFDGSALHNLDMIKSKYLVMNARPYIRCNRLGDPQIVLYVDSTSIQKTRLHLDLNAFDVLWTARHLFPKSKYLTKTAYGSITV
jgi:hypothetical protein